ncbi:cell wall-binding repeat-containing protein [Guptibacillus hwajinpoensis]|uniref:Cell wall-binding protein/5-hydroxyisourate hydrolase-like protein (Transthyretin family) n=1 Tax=Guptibacillus hwajinpoensis TaxID=208199 RepID=A0ABU0JZA3_9BACL|nr:cell wall-binding repeat-containing protein [Alkalihalobacillus hemicentroti]MDQ0482422.1 putative cell wall-binding protein/5-hydroxyisourate hydrolase-like protein (transthyretin family) [Alkalihalobacillus hemicentroti]
MSRWKLVQWLLLFLIVGGLLLSPHSYVIANDDGGRVAGEDRYETAALISKSGWENGSKVVVVARGDNFADALAGSPLAKKVEAPILLSKSNSLPDVTSSELQRLKTEKVILLGGVEALSNSVKGVIEDMGITVERIGGEDRYDTSIKIAERIGSKETAVMATGLDFADALAIAPYAAEKQYPILLTRPDRLNESVDEYVDDFADTIVVGGVNAVSTKVEEKLPSPLRLAGETRYETAAAIISHFYETNNHVYVSTGREFADALSGSLLAAKEGTAVMLVAPDKVPDRVNTLVAEQKVRSFEVFGGPEAVDDQVVESLKSIISEYSDTEGAATLSEDAVVMTETEETLLEQAIENATIFDNGTFEITVPSSSKLATYEVGKLFVIPPDEEHPTGLMVQIGDKKNSGDKTTLLLGQPAIEDMFEEIKFSADKELTVDNIIGMDLHDGVTLQAPGGEEVSSYDEFQKAMLKQKSAPSTLKGDKFEFGSMKLAMDAILYEKETANRDMEVKLNGTMELNDMVGSTKIKKSRFSGKMKSFDMKFDADQTMKSELSVNWEGDIFPDDKKDDRKKILEGVDRSDRITIGSVTFTVGSIVLGEEARSKVPIGLTVFFVTTLDGEIELVGKLSFIDEQSHHMDVNWKSKDNKFVAIAESEQVKSEASLDVEGMIEASLAGGIDAGLSIYGLVPAIVENEMRQSVLLEGNGTVAFDFLDSDLSPEVEGCFLAEYKIDLNSDLKARMKASLGWWEFGFEYERQIGHINLFETGFDMCIPSGAVTGSVSDAVSKEKLPGVKVIAYKDGEFFRTATSEDNGSYELDLQPGSYKLVYKKNGYKDEVLHHAEVTRDGLTYNPELKLVSDQHQGSGEVSGEITDAINGNPVNGATIEFRKGVNAKDGDVIQTTATQENGQYNVSLDAGSYTGTITKEGYVAATFTITSLGGIHSKNQNATITPLLDDSETRIVLSWGENPSDLDSHLVGLSNGEERFHVYYGDRSYFDGDFSVMLDTDDTTSFGPETITLNQTEDGVYEYFVHDYSNQGEYGSNALSDSDAKVEVYKGSYLIKTFYVPTNKTGVVWKVFNIENGQIIPINEVREEYTSGGSSINSPPSFKDEIQNSLTQTK